MLPRTEEIRTDPPAGSSRLKESKNVSVRSPSTAVTQPPSVPAPASERPAESSYDVAPSGAWTSTGAGRWASVRPVLRSQAWLSPPRVSGRTRETRSQVAASCFALPARSAD